MKYAIFLVILLLLFGCASRQPMRFAAAKPGLTQTDYSKAKEECAAEHKSGGYFAVGPAPIVGAIAVVGEASRAQARRGFLACMENKGFRCIAHCPSRSDAPASTEDGKASPNTGS